MVHSAWFPLARQLLVRTITFSRRPFDRKLEALRSGELPSSVTKNVQNLILSTSNTSEAFHRGESHSLRVLELAQALSFLPRLKRLFLDRIAARGTLCATPPVIARSLESLELCKSKLNCGDVFNLLGLLRPRRLQIGSGMCWSPHGDGLNNVIKEARQGLYPYSCESLSLDAASGLSLFLAMQLQIWRPPGNRIKLQCLKFSSISGSRDGGVRAVLRKLGTSVLLLHLELHGCYSTSGKCCSRMSFHNLIHAVC